MDDSREIKVRNAFPGAAEAVREPDRSWPDFPLDFVVGRMFRNSPDYRDDILMRIGKYDPITLSES